MSDTLIEPLLRSPQLIEHAEALNRFIAAERQRRRMFYDELTEDGKWEFINGEVVLQSPARHRHIAVSMRLAHLLTAWVNLHHLGRITTEKAHCQFPRNDYEPDVAFFGPAKADRIKPDTLLHPVPEFVAEILSDSTEAVDRGVKFQDYAAHGVAEYWIVDAERETVEPFLADDGAYPRSVRRVRSGRIASRVIEGFEIPVRALFEDAANLDALRRMLGPA